MPPYFERSYVTVRWDAATESVLAEWKEYPITPDLREAMEKILGLLRERRSARWISLYHKSIATRPEDAAWIAEAWMERARSAGLRRIAFVLPREGGALVRMTIKRIIKAIDKGVETQLHESLESARTWIERLGDQSADAAAADYSIFDYPPSEAGQER